MQALVFLAMNVLIAVIEDMPNHLPEKNIMNNLKE